MQLLCVLKGIRQDSFLFLLPGGSIELFVFKHVHHFVKSYEAWCPSLKKWEELVHLLKTGLLYIYIWREIIQYTFNLWVMLLKAQFHSLHIVIVPDYNPWEIHTGRALIISVLHTLNNPIGTKVAEMQCSVPSHHRVLLLLWLTDILNVKSVCFIMKLWPWPFSGRGLYKNIKSTSVVISVKESKQLWPSRDWLKRHASVDDDRVGNTFFPPKWNGELTWLTLTTLHRMSFDLTLCTFLKEKHLEQNNTFAIVIT